MSSTLVLVLSGLVIGALFGAVVQRTNFCSMGAISDAVALGDTKRLRAWLLAIAVAIAGTNALLLAGLVAVDKSFYLAPRVAWIAMLAGGLLFGFGMVLAGGCASRTVVRVGAGSLKSFVVFIVMGLVGYMTARGLLYYVRTAVETVGTDLGKAGLPGQGLPSLASAAFGLGAGTAIAVVAGLAAVAIAAWCFKDRSFRRSARDIAAGLALGSLVTAGWWATGWLAADEFEPVPPVSLTLIGPSGDALQYLMTFTGAKISFGVAVVFGILIGSFAAAVAGKTFRIEMFADRDDMLRHMGGAALMGFGGVMAAGCTVGQGITGAATLGIGSLLALAGIVGGAVFSVRLLMWRMERASLDRGI
ncbi:MAG: YeeE/YedE family protein [Alphaproteobacteria bacterium]